MDVAGSAVGIASLGIQICQGLLSYYDSWKDYKSDISGTYECIADLCRTLTLIQESIGRAGLDQARATRVKTCLDSCVDGLDKLQKKLQKLQTHTIPTGLRQRAWAEVQRSFYPFRQSTLMKLKEIGSDLRARLSLALQVFQLDVSIGSDDTVKRIEINTKTVAITTQNTASHVQALRAAQQATNFQTVIDWLSPPDPWTNHAAARQLHEPHTGEWMLQSDQYKRWRSGHTRHLWLYGKAGCGKTVLSSTVIEDLKVYHEHAANSCLAAFYFSFSDNRKQSFESLLRSLVAQVGWKEPRRSILQREYDKPNRSVLGTEALEEIFLSCVASSDEVFLALDALDECPETDEARRKMLDCLERLSGKASELRIFATSRELWDVKECMELLGAEFMPTGTRPVGADIGKYVASELSQDRRLSRLDESIRILIMQTFADKADGMFRWAYCQLQELKKLKSTRPSHVRAALLALPSTLDETYERILTRIDRTCHVDALVLLRWLAYSQSPPRLCELVEATIIDLSGEGHVHIDDRGGLEDVLNILAELVTIGGTQTNGNDNNNNDADSLDGETKDSESLGRSSSRSLPRIDGDTTIRLGHFSVREYLESERIVQSDAKDFHLEKPREHGFLSESCLTYLLHYSSSDKKTATKDDLMAFPLLEYCARSWFYHSSFRSSADVPREVYLLDTESTKYDWLRIYQPDLSWKGPFQEVKDVGSSLYYASLLGLGFVVNALLEAGIDANAQGGWYGNALQAASEEGHEEVVQMLIDAGADVNTQGGDYNTALQAALKEGHEKVVKILIDAGADVNASGGEFGNTLHIASVNGDEKLVQVLIDSGADVNAQSGVYGYALQAALLEGHEKVVQMLMDAGADVNAQGGQYGNALQMASASGHNKLVKVLLDAGADVNAQGGLYGYALQAASASGYEKVVQMLMDAGADINAQGGHYYISSALQEASAGGHEKIVQMLIDAGADVNTQGGDYGTALQAASEEGHEKVVKMLIDIGADVNTQGGEYGSALQAALSKGHEKVVKMLMDAGADANV